MSLNIFSVAVSVRSSLFLLCAALDVLLQVGSLTLVYRYTLLFISNHEAVSDDAGLDCPVLRAWGGPGNMAQRH